MEATKLTINKETIEMANKPLTNKRRGELRMKKLEELAKSGKLAMIRNRGDLAEAVGYSYKQRSKTGYQWVHYKVKKGVLQETLVGYTNGIPEYEYKLVGYEPIVKTTVPKTEEPAVEEKHNEETVATIYINDATIALENVSGDTIVEIIKVIKGEY